MRDFLLAAAIAIASPHAASAQATDALPLVRNCNITATAEKGQPRLVLGDTKNGEKVANFIQINGPTKLSGPLDPITISITPSEATMTTKGFAPKANGSYVRANITEGWAALLDKIRKGKELTLSAGGETITISLVGSAAAVAALERCAR